jgi:hypothetical protein
LRIDARRATAALLDPARFGTNRTETTIVGDPERPVYVAVPLMPHEIEDRMSRLLAECESEMGLPVLENLSHKERLRNMLISEQPLPPPIYAIANQSREPK